MSYLNRVKISGNFPVTSNNPPSYFLTADSVMRVEFIVNEETPFESAQFGIIKAEGINVFVGLFTLSSGNQVTVIQIPLIGQSINDLVEKINSYPGVVAEVSNSFGFLSSSVFLETTLVNGTNRWVYFSGSDKNTNNVYSTLKNDIKFYRTTPEPVSIQRNLGQCLGGFVSTNTLYNYATISSPLSIYDNVINIDPATFSESSTINRLNQSPYLQINDEIVKVNSWSGYTVYVSERNAFGTPLRFHPQNSVIQDLNKNDLFDFGLGETGKQYRCIAIKNMNQTEIAKDLKVFFSLSSRNNLSEMKIAVECPKSDYYSGFVTGGGITAFSVTDLVGLFDEDHYAGCPLIFTTGLNKDQIRIIKSYNPTSGNIVLEERLPNNILPGDKFYIDTAPAERVKFGAKRPSINVSDFYSAEGLSNAVSINVLGKRLSGKDLYPNEVIYIWIERTVFNTNDEFLNNRVVIDIRYSKV